MAEVIEASPTRSSRSLPTSVRAWLRLARVYQKMERAGVEQMRCFDLSFAHFDVLAQVSSAEGVTQQQLADSLMVTKGNVCQLLDRMETASLIERRQEGRSNRLFLTDRGRKLVEQVLPEHERMIAAKVSVLSPEEQDQLLGLLRKLDRSLM